MNARQDFLQFQTLELSLGAIEVNNFWNLTYDDDYIDVVIGFYYPFDEMEYGSIAECIRVNTSTDNQISI